MVKTGDSSSQRSCSVPQCKSRGNEIALFYFPKDESLRKKWTDAIKIEKRVSPGMQVCSRHFLKNDYIFPDFSSSSKVRRLKKTAVPSQNLPWQFPNKHVSPALAKARLERLKNRTQQKGSVTPERKIETDKKKEPETIKESITKDDLSLIDEEEDPFLKELVKEEKDSDSDDVTEHDVVGVIQKKEKKIDNKVSEAKKPVSVSISDKNGDKVPVVKLSSTNKKTSADKKRVIHMRTRAPTRLRRRKGVLKCELCGRKCLTPQALRTHQLIAHKNTRSNQSSPEKKSPAINKPKETPKPSIVVPLISVKQQELLIPKVAKEKSLDESSVERVLRDFDSEAMDTDFSSESDLEKEAQQTKPGKKDKIKTEFECPKCRRRFAVYFSAFRHIQKHHAGAQQKSASGLPITLKPVRIEICALCNMALAGDVHVCGGPLKLAVGFFCTGCNQEFKTLTLFDMHKSGMHSEGVESMFFPTLDEFENWKYRMENQTKVRYTILDQNDTKKIHRCTHLTTYGSGAQSRSRMCPSSIIVQEFAKGFQVHYYPNHFGHSSQTYALSNVFKKYSIASLMNMATNVSNMNKQPSQPTQPTQPTQKPSINSEDLIGETDLYLQLKKLTELVVNEAAKINVNGLKKIMRKVLEIVPIITSYVEDDDDDMSSTLPPRQDTEDLQEQINKAFQSFNIKEPRKRKSVDVDTLLVKKSKPVFQSTENTLKEQRSKAQVRKSASIAKLKEDSEIKLDKKESNRENVKFDIKKDNITPVSIQKNFNQSPSFIDQYQKFVGKSLVKAADKKKAKIEPKKKLVKTKIGQFKPSPPKKVNSPKIASPKTDKDTSSRNSISNVKEVKYEVKEQENDCNILILKI